MFKRIQPLYPLLLKATQSNPEEAHQQLLKSLKYLDRTQHTLWGRTLISQLRHAFCYEDFRLEQTLWGLKFNNPLGLAPGCDKDGVAAGIWPHFGFGFAELGAVTLHPQPGNPKPRLFRLPLDKAALNRLGANNRGAKQMAHTLQESWQRHPRRVPIGINLCKSKVTPLEAAAEDYVGSFRALADWADYFVVNVSSPNTPGLRSLQSGEQLETILAALTPVNPGKKPLLVKISPDLDWEAIAAIVELSQTYHLAGLVATNTTTQRQGLTTQILRETGNSIQLEAGGISGLPVRDRATAIIRFIYQKTQGKLPIIGVGGIFTAEDAWEKITAGASLLQIYTGWIYQGPWCVPQILTGLVAKLAQNNLTHLSQAVGMAAVEPP